MAVGATEGETMKVWTQMRLAVPLAAAVCAAAAGTPCAATSHNAKRFLLQSWQSQTINRPHSCVNDCVPDLDQNEQPDREGPVCPPM